MELTVSQKNRQTFGISMSKEYFNENYVGSDTTKISITQSTKTDAIIDFQNIAYDSYDNTIKLSANISRDGEVSELNASGKLYNDGRKQSENIHSVVGILKDENEQFDILHFEIYNSKTEDVFNIDPSFIGVPHFKLQQGSLSISLGNPQPDHHKNSIGK